ncbi:MAG: energy-coupling factor ABC transporter ATP-binding protein, partial [Gemmataceae bacterium]
MSIESAIRVAGLSFAYPDGRAALADLRFEITANEVVGLIGPNGAGKTTLFLCLAGVLPGRPGVVSLAGLDPAVPADRRRLPEHIGVVFQSSDDQLFNATVFDDVAFGPLNLGLPPDEVRSRVMEALARVGLTGSDERVPFHLSGGEQRRVALAGVLAMRPDILLLDEPTMFLDPRGRRELMRLLGEIAGTKMIATH